MLNAKLAEPTGEVVRQDIQCSSRFFDRPAVSSQLSLEISPFQALARNSQRHCLMPELFVERSVILAAGNRFSACALSCIQMMQLSKADWQLRTQNYQTPKQVS